jgi:hypothetical protein
MEVIRHKTETFLTLNNLFYSAIFALFPVLKKLIKFVNLKMFMKKCKNCTYR